eukprot:1150529-Pelagomonas_calceolata.AAC.8
MCLNSCIEVAGLQDFRFPTCPFSSRRPYTLGQSVDLRGLKNTTYSASTAGPLNSDRWHQVGLIIRQHAWTGVATLLSFFLLCAAAGLIIAASKDHYSGDTVVNLRTSKDLQALGVTDNKDHYSGDTMVILQTSKDLQALGVTDSKDHYSGDTMVNLQTSKDLQALGVTDSKDLQETPCKAKETQALTVLLSRSIRNICQLPLVLLDPSALTWGVRSRHPAGLMAAHSLLTGHFHVTRWPIKGNCRSLRDIGEDLHVCRRKCSDMERSTCSL